MYHLETFSVVVATSCRRITRKAMRWILASRRRRAGSTWAVCSAAGLDNDVIGKGICWEREGAVRA